MLQRRGDGDGGPDPLRVGGHPLEDLHPAHRTARHAEQALDPQKIDQMPLGLDHVGDRDEGKVRPVGLPGLRIHGGGPGAPLAPADHVGADDEILVRVEGLPRPDHRVPPPGSRLLPEEARGVGVPGKGVQDEDRVGLLAVELPVGFVGERHRPQGLPAFELQRVGPFGEGDLLRLDDAEGAFIHLELRFRWFRFHCCFHITF